jgi:hypothetical protein
MNKEQQELLDEAYEKALMKYGFNSLPGTPPGTVLETQEIFINKCKTDDEFSEKWGLRIEERELNDKERVKLYEQKTNIDTSFFPVLRETLNFHNIPTKLTTVTYNNKTIESYE